MKTPGPRNLPASVAALAGHCGFEGPILAGSIRRTFAKRGTPVPEEEPVGLMATYWDDPARVVQVRAFARRSGIPLGPDVASDILPLLRGFLLPILDDVRRGTDELEAWPAGANFVDHELPV